MANPMTTQQVFDTVATHLLTQGRAAVSVGACLLRGPGGTKCALGCLIPDALYTADMEVRSSPTAFCVSFPSVVAAMGLSLSDRGLLDDLQFIHDNAEPEAWRDELLGLAHERGLDRTCVTSHDKGG